MSDITQWASGGTSTAPSNAYILQGFVAGESPASANFNWLINSLVDYTDTQVGSISGNGVDTTGAIAGNIAYFDGTNVVTDTPINVIGASTESLQGLIEIATQAEVDSGTDDTKAVTALKLKSTLDTRLGANSLPIDSTSGVAGNLAYFDGTSLVLDSYDNLIPDASETVKGIQENATALEAQTGTATDKTIVPATLKSTLDTRFGATNTPMNTTGMTAGQVLVMNAGGTALEPANAIDSIPSATTAVEGKVELATNTEAQTGTATNKVLTPANLASVTSTETRAGIAAIVATAEVVAGTDDAKIVTTKKLDDLLDFTSMTDGQVAVWDSTLNAGAGGFKPTFDVGLGAGQTWQDVIGSRTAGVTYTNTTGRSIFVSIYIGKTSSGDAVTIFVDGIGSSTESTVNARTTLTTIVPAGTTYSLVDGGAGLLAVYRWFELR